ncbi:hypothetical protein L1857_13435 [Amycolatopsis thermalba]|uniref:Transcriptional regulator n=2 Tax=Amycolatopsis TaxID=1813 RepID=A0ABY4NUM0_9PSEU|nr:hypothetical protein [Amycolatopsis thermalba]UQS23759.1 hypothetical protein L1857_13435 [Amycolatopsis thermalba]
MPRDPNEKLRRLLAVADWTREGLARAVNAVAAESGRVLTYDRTSVSHWLRGSLPRGDTPLYVAEALSRRLGRVVTPDEVGFPRNDQGDPGGGRDGCTDAIAALRDLAREDLSSVWTGIPQKRLYRQVDLEVAPWPETLPASRPSAPVPRRAAAAEALTMMTSAFATADQRFGGGHARGALVAYLAGDVVEAAHRASPGAPQRAVCAAAARSCDLAGFMSFDSNLHGLALAYFRLALRLAIEAVDQNTYAAVLRNISLQALTLGDTASAARIAEMALATAPDSMPRQQLAELLGHVAITRAALNEPNAARQALADAERILATSGAENATLTYQRGVVLEHAGDLAEAQRALAVSLKQRPPHERRSRALTSARLAGLRLRTGQMGKARTVIRTLLDDHAGLSSGRVDSALEELNRHLGRFRRHPSSNVLLLEVRERLRHPTTRPTGGECDDAVQA